MAELTEEEREDLADRLEAALAERERSDSPS